jgi:hypothetical protein
VNTKLLSLPILLAALAFPAHAADAPKSPRATLGDSVVEPEWDQRLSVSVGPADADIVGTGERAIQAAVDNVARFGDLELLAVVRVHAEHTRDAHLAALVRDVVDGVARAARALVHAEVGELPVLVLLQLEGEADEGLARIRFDHELGFVVVLIVAFVPETVLFIPRLLGFVK